MDKGTFIETIAPICKEHMQRHRILASLTIAQAVLEGFRADGTDLTELAKNYYNIFGIKGTGPAGSALLWTNEWDGKQMVRVQAPFRCYHSWEESISDHTELFTSLQRYNNLIGEFDYQRACLLVQKDGYATDPNYTSKLVAIIETYGLTRYDQEAIVEAEIPEWGKEARTELTQLGITDGERPSDPVTRLEAWATILRTIRLLDGRRTDFEDSIRAMLPGMVQDAIPVPRYDETIPEWASAAFVQLVGLEIFDGSRPGEPATRAEVATMLHRTIQFLYEDILDVTERLTLIENQLEEKGFIGKLADLIMKPFRRMGDGV